MRISLHPGVWSNGLSLLLASVGTVTVATATQSALLHLGEAGIIAGIALFLWGIRIDGKPWWRALHRQKLPPTVYLRNTDAKSSHFEDKMFRIRWVENSLSLTFRGEGSDGFDEDKKPIVEPTLTFELLNAGAEPVRHVVARWRLPNVDLEDDVKLLGKGVRSFEAGRRLKMQTENGSASIQPVSLNAESEPIPVISAGASAELKAPTSFTNAYSIRALARARRGADRQAAQNPNHDALQMLEQFREPMDRAFIDLSYAKDGKVCRHSFFIVGLVWGGSQPHVRSQEANRFELTPGITATVDHVGVLHK